MKFLEKKFILLILPFLIAACSEKKTPEVSITTLEASAIEKENQLAKFYIERSSTKGTLLVDFQLSGNTDVTLGSASEQDYVLKYSDGGEVGQQLEFKASQNSRVIEVHPVLDELHEVPETLVIELTANNEYELTEQVSAQVVITDASNHVDNAKVFIGIFEPQDDVATTASGVLSLILQGDNQQASLNYTFNNLTSLQTDQHIHLAPAGSMIKDLESVGPLKDYLWDLAPGGIFTTEQQMLDTLFKGEFFVNIHTANYPNGEIFARMIYESGAKPPEQEVLSQQDIDNDIIRFLTQATFGPTEESYQALRAQIDEDGSNRLQVYGAWIEQQFNQPTTSKLAFLDATAGLFGEEKYYFSRRDAFWPLAVYGKDQLRQRMAFALSEILVIGDEPTVIRNAGRGTAHYWDMLADNAFTTYRKTLEDVSFHPIMGYWLSHIRNQKANAELGYYPDENYAREIMQLFTFGLVQRNLNGTIKLGEDNLPMATYDNQVIKEMARVFTGLSFGFISDNGEKVENTRFSQGNSSNQYQYRWTSPMKVFSDYHDHQGKQLFSDNGNTFTVPANDTESSEAAVQELGLVFDGLVGHSGTAPFISRQLIQRFVTSNPSPEYIERVAHAFGASGDLKATIRAILLDPEARNPAALKSTTFGKVKEPVLQLTALMRLLKASSSIPLGQENDGLALDMADHFEQGASLMRIGELPLGQRPLGSASVFNFFSPDFTPTGALANQSLTSPELQILTEAQLVTTYNLYEKLLRKGLNRGNAAKYSEFSTEQLNVTLSGAPLETVWQHTNGDDTAKAAAVVDYLDFYLNAGQLQLTEQSTIRQSFIDAIVNSDQEDRLELAIFAVATMPQFFVQR